MDLRRTDTRSQLQSVALSLFAEKGYDATSLREIADVLGITKAAVYYHFRSKDEILVSSIEDFLGRLDELLRWGTSSPAGADTRVEVLRRYDALLSGPTALLARLVREGLPAIRDDALRTRISDCYLALFDLLSPPGPHLEGRLRARVALSSLHLGTTSDPEHADESERRAAALAIAEEVLSPRRGAT
ncbi:TetR family transcriptional regulator [Mycolicibacterium madagascariense]|uniref:TetR family transcriptional regulator n=1 Tax=Mycolicibacterium madagascariense TaxID=212765 RepID=A0A7I7XEI2_9MYCO|nr:helix-turn-helix domain-containing protein [Mycolicibacterium madagascariense]MCV7011722.1 helix-turn-helix transcriptional regulator [Mycolicibacterium madagascariense]BBZ27358.1 TetR family transcriptional regulator [Mycolicibacterium madagascariense]